MRCKQNCYMVSLWVIIKAICNHTIIIAWHTHESHTRAHVYTVRTCKNTCSACTNLQIQTRQHACGPCTHPHIEHMHMQTCTCVYKTHAAVCVQRTFAALCVVSYIPLDMYSLGRSMFSHACVLYTHTHTGIQHMHPFVVCVWIKCMQLHVLYHAQSTHTDTHVHVCSVTPTHKCKCGCFITHVMTARMYMYRNTQM